MDVCGLDSSNGSYVITYEDDTNTRSRGIVGNSTGTTINGFGTVTTFDDGNSPFTACAGLTTTKFMASWGSYDNDVGRSIVCDVDGSFDLTCGSTADFSTGSGDIGYTGMTKHTSEKSVIVYEDRGAGDDGKSTYSSISGTTITHGSEETWSTNDIDYSTVTLIDTNKVVVCFYDTTSTDGKCIIGDIAEVEPPEDTCTYSGTGDWIVNYSDDCYVTEETYVLGDCNIIYDAAGSFNLQETLICDELNVGANADISAENSTAEIQIY